jgi:hypothetical protein
MRIGAFVTLEQNETPDAFEDFIVVENDQLPNSKLRLCKHCECQFEARRKDKVYCSTKCRVYSSRPIQNSEHSNAKKRKNAEFFDTALRMAERLYSLPPFERLGYLKDLIDEARSGNTKLREILSNYKLLHPHPKNEKWMFPRKSRAYSTIAQAAHGYCWLFWKADVYDVVYNRAPEPEDGVIHSKT